MKLIDTRDAVTWLVGDADQRRREAARAALYRWLRAGQLVAYGDSSTRGRRWDLTEVARALRDHVERYGAPPWENGRGPKGE
ncbi:hypothetical protein [Streptomyces microflavus]|uniref:hypothetical protein n=1 Tax=Streptomyces microflavus TaxID=1919 RepID=UPI0036A4E7D0